MLLLVGLPGLGTRVRTCVWALQVLVSIAKEMKELNFVRPICIMFVRADLKLLASVGTVLLSIVGVVSRQLSKSAGTGVVMVTNSTV